MSKKGNEKISTSLSIIKDTSVFNEEKNCFHVAKAVFDFIIFPRKIESSVYIVF